MTETTKTENLDYYRVQTVLTREDGSESRRNQTHKINTEAYALEVAAGLEKRYAGRTDLSVQVVRVKRTIVTTTDVETVYASETVEADNLDEVPLNME